MRYPGKPPLRARGQRGAALRLCQILAKALNGQGEGGDTLTQPGRKGALVDTPGPELSVVPPVCNQEENLGLLYRRLAAALDAEGMPYEIVFGDDGSQDGGLELIHGLAAKGGRIVIAELARNLGQQVAINVGLDYARGNAVITMDANLHDPPEG